MKSILLIKLLPYLFFLFIVVICSFNTTTPINKEEEKRTVFIWNDDEETIPKDNTLITLEFTSNDTIYIGKYDENANIDKY